MMLFVIRTHRPLPPAIVQQAQRVAAKLGRDSVVVAADESRGTVDSHGFHKVRLSTASYAELGLHSPGDVMWRCGDYVLHAVKARFPQATSIFMLEYDVRMKFADISGQLQRLAASGADLIAARLWRPAPDWEWDAAAARHYPGERRACLFPIVYVGQAALARLLDGRRKASLRAGEYTLDGAGQWLNDEAFVANEIAVSGLKTLGFGEVWPNCGEWDTLRWRPPFLQDAIDSLPPDDKIYHPVLGAAEFASRSRSEGQGLGAARALLESHGYDVEGRKVRENARYR